MSIILLFITGLLHSLYYVRATNYVFIVNENGLVPCAGEEENFIDRYFDMSNINCEQLDEETMVLNGDMTFLKTTTPNLPLKFRLDIEKLTSGRLMKTAFGMDRENICESFFDKDALWNDFVSEFKDDNKLCPPKKGVKYVFKNKTVPMAVNQLAPGLEGHYVATVHFNNADINFCLVLEGDVVRKELKQKKHVMH